MAGMRICGFLSNVYGPSIANQKSSLLDSMLNLRVVVGPCPWILGGDFNLIHILEEKQWGIRKLNPINKQFNEVIEALYLVDIRTSNSIFT